MTKTDEIWLKCMKACAKYWGCHQMPSRSYFIGKYQFPLCARCTGILLGYFTEAIFLVAGIKVSILISVFLVMPTFFDGLIQWKTSYESKNIIRISTGYFAGMGIISFIVEVAKILGGGA